MTSRLLFALPKRTCYSSVCAVPMKTGYVKDNKLLGVGLYYREVTSLNMLFCKIYNTM